MTQDNFLFFLLDSINKIIQGTGFANVEIGNIFMILIGILFIYLAIKKEWEPMLLVPIGFGMIVGNIPFLEGTAVGIKEEGTVLNILYSGSIVTGKQIGRAHV